MDFIVLAEVLDNPTNKQEKPTTHGVRNFLVLVYPVEGVEVSAREQKQTLYTNIFTCTNIMYSTQLQKYNFFTNNEKFIIRENRRYPRHPRSPTRQELLKLKRDLHRIMR